jgi:hypothetical protein
MACSAGEGVFFILRTRMALALFSFCFDAMYVGGVHLAKPDENLGLRGACLNGLGVF